MFIMHKLITEITLKLIEIEREVLKDRIADRRLILGYYYQKNAFYEKKDKGEELL